MLRRVASQLIVATVFAYCQCGSDEGGAAVHSDLDGVGVSVAAGGKVWSEEARPPSGTPIGKTDPPSAEDHMKLFQYDPVHIGHVHQVPDESGRVMELITAAVNPPVFEINNFLSSEECDHVIGLALEKGLKHSGVIREPLPSLSDSNEDEIRDIFGELDEDDDRRLGPGELAEGLVDIAEGLLSEGAVRLLMADFKLDPDGDDHLDFEEFKLSWTPDWEKSVSQWVKTRQASNDTAFHSSKTRVSDQTWLDQSWHEDDILENLQERVVKLLQIPRDLVVSSESLQVVRYQTGGHYHAHLDSSELNDTLICSHTENVADDDKARQQSSETLKTADTGSLFDRKTLRLCRFATVLFYLSDVEEGGETAFPVADNETYSEEALDASPHDIHDLTHHCYDSNLVVKPAKGKAILWYNHMINTSNGWMGDRYNTSLHGGCDVRKGEKWIANNWINIDDVYRRQVDYHESFHRELDTCKRERERNRQIKANEPTDGETATDHPVHNDVTRKDADVGGGVCDGGGRDHRDEL